MKLWVSAETQADVGKKLTLARGKIKNKINEKIENVSYDIPLDGWDVIIILRDDSRMKDIIKYSKKKKDMDFRICIDYPSFVKASSLEAERLHFKALQRSLEILKEKFIKERDIHKLISDVYKVGKENNWT